MIIYNTTFHVEKGHDNRFLHFVRSDFIPKATASGVLTDPRIALILAHQESDEGTSYSVQFSAPDIDSLRSWYDSVGAQLIEHISTTFSQHVVGFSTLLQALPLSVK